MTDGLKAAAEKMNSAGFSLWDIFYEDTSVLRISYEGGRPETIVSGNEAGAGIRGIKGSGCFYAAANTRDGLKKALESASAAAPLHADFREIKCPGTHAAIKDPSAVSIPDKINLVKGLYDRVRSEGPEIIQATINYLEKKQDIIIFNDTGVHVADSRTYVSVSVLAVAAKNNRVETGYEVSSGLGGYELFDREDVMKKAGKAAAAAIRQLSTDLKISGTMAAVIHSSAGGTLIHEAVGHSLEADIVGKGMSVYGGKTGEKAASPLVTVIDDAALPFKRGSFCFDDEGVPAQKTVLQCSCKRARPFSTEAIQSW